MQQAPGPGHPRTAGNGRAPDALARVDVLTPDGDGVSIGDLWKTRPVVLAFVRHFG